MKYGLLADHIVVRGEDPAEFDSLHEGLIDAFLPLGSQEEHLVERIAACMWRFRRIYRIGAGIFTHESLAIEFDRARNETKNIRIKHGEVIDCAFIRSADHGREAA